MLLKPKVITNDGSSILVGGSAGELAYIGSDGGVDTVAYQNLDASIGKVRTKGEGDQAGRQSWP